MTDNHEIEGKVRAFILDSFLTEADAEALRDDSDLLRMLDSLQILRMLMAFESTFGIKVEDADLTPENLGSVRRVAAMIARKRGAGPRQGHDTPPLGPVAVDQSDRAHPVG